MLATTFVTQSCSSSSTPLSHPLFLSRGSSPLWNENQNDSFRAHFHTCHCHFLSIIPLNSNSNEVNQSISAADMISRISIIYLFLFLSKSFILAAERNSDEPKPVVIPIPAGRDLFADLTEISYNKRRKAYWLTTSHNVSIAVATAGKSQQLQTTGLTALQFGCDVGATNGGPFNLDGSNSGPAVIKGRKVQTEAPTDYVGFGTTCDGKYLFGNYYQLASSEQIWEFVTGFGWLVYDGSVVVGPSEDEKKAPRTIIGLDQDSNLISVVVDGCERW